jgi:hypothetical protein
MHMDDMNDVVGVSLLVDALGREWGCLIVNHHEELTPDWSWLADHEEEVEDEELARRNNG